MSEPEVPVDGSGAMDADAIDKLATLNERIMHHLDTGDSSGEDEPS